MVGDVNNSGPMGGVGKFVKKHPIAIVVGIVAVGGVYLILVNSGSSASSSGASSAELSAQVALAQLNGQLQSQSAQNGANMAQLQQQQAGTYQLAQLNATTSTAQQVNQLTAQQNIVTQQADVAKLQISTSAAVQEQSLATQLQIQQSNNSAAISMASLAAQMNEFIAGVNANQNISIAGIQGQTQLGLSQNAATVAIMQAKYGSDAIIAQSQANADIAKTVSNNNFNSSAMQSGFGLMGDLLGMFL